MTSEQSTPSVIHKEAGDLCLTTTLRLSRRGDTEVALTQSTRCLTVELIRSTMNLAMRVDTVLLPRCNRGSVGTGPT